jgi:hypothetical protein
MKSKSKATPKIELPFWKKDGNLWYADPTDIELAVIKCGLDEDGLRRRLGAGYHYLAEAMQGKRFDGWTASHLDWALANTPYVSPPRYGSIFAGKGCDTIVTEPVTRPPKTDKG